MKSIDGVEWCKYNDNGGYIVHSVSEDVDYHKRNSDKIIKKKKKEYYVQALWFLI